MCLHDFVYVCLFAFSHPLCIRINPRVWVCPLSPPRCLWLKPEVLLPLLLFLLHHHLLLLSLLILLLLPSSLCVASVPAPSRCPTQLLVVNKVFYMLMVCFPPDKEQQPPGEAPSFKPGHSAFKKGPVSNQLFAFVLNTHVKTSLLGLERSSGRVLE